MWIAVIGAAGTCKRAVVDELVKKDGFIFEPEVLQFSEPPTMLEQARAICERWKAAVNLAKKEDADFLSIRTFWDSEVYFSAMHECRMITLEQFETLMEFHRTMGRGLTPPHGAIYLRATPIQAQARCALTGKIPDAEFESIVRRRYDDHISRMNISVVEIDNQTDQFENVITEVRSAMNDFRSSNIGGATIWKRSYYK